MNFTDVGTVESEVPDNVSGTNDSTDSPALPVSAPVEIAEEPDHSPSVSGTTGEGQSPGNRAVSVADDLPQCTEESRSIGVEKQNGKEVEDKPVEFQDAVVTADDQHGIPRAEENPALGAEQDTLADDTYVMIDKDEVEKEMGNDGQNDTDDKTDKPISDAEPVKNEVIECPAG